MAVGGERGLRERKRDKQGQERAGESLGFWSPECELRKFQFLLLFSNPGSLELSRERAVNIPKPV